jgi:RNA polymerase sigma factor (sigma-70 family)
MGRRGGLCGQVPHIEGHINVKKRLLIPRQRESILPLLCPTADLPPESHAQWGYIENNEPTFRRFITAKVGESHEGDVSDKAFQGLHTRLKSGPVEKEIRDYAWKSFGNAARSFSRALAKQRARELLVGEDTFILEESPQPVAGYVVHFDEDVVAATASARVEIERCREMFDELEPSELIALTLVRFNHFTSQQAAELLGITDGAVRNAVFRARKKLQPMHGRLGLA